MAGLPSRPHRSYTLNPRDLTDILIMIHSGPPPKTRMTWGLNAVSGREAAKPVLAPVAVVYVVLNPSTNTLHSWGWGPIKRLIKK